MKCSGVEMSERSLFVSETQGHCRQICLALLKFRKNFEENENIYNNLQF